MSNEYDKNNERYNDMGQAMYNDKKDFDRKKGDKKDAKDSNSRDGKQRDNNLRNTSQQESRLAALKLHKDGKIAMHLTKNIESQKDLSLAYSPWVAEPCKEIAKDKSKIWDYTIKSNTVLVVSNGSAVLGLGKIGAAASLPVLEGKAALFKRFGSVNAFPLAIDEKDPDKLIDIISKIAVNYGGINLEDIKAPECFYIEEELKKRLDIPVFHDDQHGTAVVILAGLINACKINEKDITKLKIVINGAGAGGIATARLLREYGVNDIVLCDSRGPIFKGRESVNKYKNEFACEDSLTFEQVIEGRDVFIGLSVGNILNKSMIDSLNKNAVIFALANPDPEILPSVAKSYRDDIIIATGRSDFTNQVNNVLCFPHLFAGLLKYRICKIDYELKFMIAKSIAKFTGSLANFSAEKIIPSIFDNGLFEHVMKDFDIYYSEKGFDNTEKDF